MTETNPEGARPAAGRAGVPGQDVTEPVTEPQSLNTVPQRAAAEQAREGRADDISQVRRDIERTRDDLGDTIEALAAKADVRARLRKRAAGVAERVRTVTPEQVRSRPAMTVGGGAAAAGIVLVPVIIRLVRARRAGPAARRAGIRAGRRARMTSMGRMMRAARRIFG